MAICLTAAAPRADAELQVSVNGLHSTKGQVMLCLTRRTQQAFLECGQDPARAAQIVNASAAQRIEFRGLVPGEYSLLVVHDENGNGKLDTMMAIPREGFGFSRNPAIRMGPPRYKDVHFAVPEGQSHQLIRIKYLL